MPGPAPATTPSLLDLASIEDLRSAGIVAGSPGQSQRRRIYTQKSDFGPIFAILLSIILYFIMKYNNLDTGLFLVRLGLAGVFITHGIMKLAGTAATISFFESIGLPGWLGVIVGIVELVAGLAMLTGLYTKHAGYALAVVMLGAIVTVKGAMGFVGGWEFDIMLLLSALAITMTGPGAHVLKMK